MEKKKYHIKKGDRVKVISGNAKGMEGAVLEVDTKKDKAIVEGVNLIKRHTKPNAAHPQGGIIEKEAPVHVSNLMLVVNGVATRVGRKKDEKGKSVRYAKKTGEIIK
jgi:large subunit ribosomal protein L24